MNASPRRFMPLVAVVLALGAGVALWQPWRADELPPEVENLLELRSLPANRWIKYHEEKPGDWHRQGHAGMAFDSRRGSLLIFGSDTHGQDWDNAVHEFVPRLKRWQTHYRPSAPETYRADEAGRPVAGQEGAVPWAMHTYDAIEYHPQWDALVAMSTTEHNPRAGQVSGVSQQPTWIYSLSTHRWTPFANGGQASPSFFGGASAYDEQRNTLMAYRGAVWELDGAAGQWRRATSGPHQMHHTMVFAPARGAAYVFGGYRPTSTVWAYWPGPSAGEEGRWEELRPGGDPCPPYSIVPVAYDAKEDVFVLMVTDASRSDGAKAEDRRASTYLYDPASNEYQKLPNAEFDPLGMNFMMAWDSHHQVVFLVTGDYRGVVTVWAMRPAKRAR